MVINHIFRTTELIRIRLKFITTHRTYTIAVLKLMNLNYSPMMQFTWNKPGLSIMNLHGPGHQK